MKTINCLIVDDEPLALQLMKTHIQQVPELKLVATAGTAFQAFEKINSFQIDLMFLDIHMPGLTGVEFLRSIQEPPPTIFTTAYRDFALDGFDLEAIDYILKPITFERFKKGVERFLKYACPQREERQYRIFKSGTQRHKVYLDDICYIESVRDYVKIVTRKNGSILSKGKISEVLELLPANRFLRVHRSFIVNKFQIASFSANTITIRDAVIPVGRRFRNDGKLDLN